MQNKYKASDKSSSSLLFISACINKHK